MNNKKSFIIRLLALSVMLGPVTSCSDFLDEELTTQRTGEYLETPEGIESLAVGLYYNLRYHFAGEWGFTYTNYGTDEFIVGADASNGMWNSYDGSFTSEITPFNSNTIRPNTLWDNMYVGINAANLLLQNAEAFVQDAEKKATYMGEAHFMRAFNYQKLVQQFGGVPLKLKASYTVEREFHRNTAQEVMEQVIADFKKAYELLPANAAMPGKITKDAAAHFLAKAYLFRASEINDSWNSATKKADLEKGLELAKEVISHRQLAPNYADLWNYSQIDGPNEQLNEIILAAQFTFDPSTTGRYGNQMHLYYLSVYRELPHMRRDIAGGREYQRLRTTYYAYNVFDRVEDSRFWKSFKTKYAANLPIKNSGYEIGDLSIMYIINKPNDARFPSSKNLKTVTDYKTGKLVPSVFSTYVGDTAYLEADKFQSRFAPLSKFLDGSREGISNTAGYRDGILARLADTYLVAAEILIRLNNYSEALTYINAVRNRAAYKEGENRRVYADGGAAYNPESNPLGYASTGTMNSFYPENSYYESNNIAVTTEATDLTVTSFADLPDEDEAIIQALGLSSDYDRALAFLLNERSRELMGELYRWEDLSRTKTLVSRVKAFNIQAASNIQDRHLLRPIPQTHLDVIQWGGSALTPAQKQQEQNPGY